MPGRSLLLSLVALLLIGALELAAQPRGEGAAVEAPVPVSVARSWPAFRGTASGHCPQDEVGRGEIVWKKQLGRTVWSSPAPSGEDIYIASDIGRLFKLGVADGTWRWSALIGSKVDATPIVAGDLVIVGTRDGYLAARDTATGGPKWAAAGTTLIHAAAAYCADPEQIVFVDGGGEMAGVSLDGQKLLWKRSNGVPVLNSPVVVEHMLYGAAGKSMFALDLRANREMWLTTMDSGVRSSVCATDDLVLVGCANGELVALRRADGSRAWRVKATDQIESTPAVRDGVVYFGSHDGKLRAVKVADGARVWEATMQGPINSSPAVTPKHVVVGCWDRHVYCVNREDGKTRWSVELGGRVASSPVVVQGMTIVGCDDGYVYGIR